MVWKMQNGFNNKYNTFWAFVGAIVPRYIN